MATYIAVAVAPAWSMADAPHRAGTGVMWQGVEFVNSTGAAAVVVGTPQNLQRSWDVQYGETQSRNAHYRFPADQARNTQALKQETDKNPVDVAVRRLEALINKLKSMRQAPDLAQAEKRLAELKGKEPTPALYRELRTLSRQVAFTNPLLDFDSILFVARGVRNDHARGKSEYDGDHFCDQYFGHNGRKGGGLLVIQNWKSADAQVVDVVKGLKVPNGTNEGQRLNDGTFISPDLSWDGKTIVFGWSSGGTQKWSPKNRFSVFNVGVDGSGLTRLTDGDFDDFDPTWLPNGRIVFMSTRRHGFGRCHGRPVPAYTMYSMQADGSDLYNIDYHETNEFHPSVDNNGMLVYTRWDYVDRDHDGAHHMWHCAPDGRNPRSFHANYLIPLTTVEGGGWPRGMNYRPWAEFNCRAIPGSDMFIATAGPHHGQAFGSLVMIDIKIKDDNKMSQVKRITPNTPFPEAEGRTRGWDRMAFGTSWPLSESFYLCNYQDQICLLDEFGNRDLVCRLANGLRPLDPMPLRARKKPPIIPCQTFQGERASKDAPVATVSIMDVNVTDEFGTLPEGAKIEQLRVVQVLPKSTPNANQPRIGFGNQSLARIPLGVVPVEKDGSVYFKAPVGKAIYFQLLDKNGMAVQSMRSVTYVHPGEQMSCLGCHEDKQQAPHLGSATTAIRRAPSELKPEVEKYVMFNFYQNVKPILDSKCVPCHNSKDNGGPKDMSYNALRDRIFYFGHGCTTALHGGSRTKPGKFGALFSNIGKALLNENHQKRMNEGKFTKQDMRSIAVWLDLNSNEYSVYKKVAEQKAGKRVYPEFDVDPENYTGVRDCLP